MFSEDEHDNLNSGVRFAGSRCIEYWVFSFRLVDRASKGEDGASAQEKTEEERFHALK